jgi:hypothetical protein
VDIRSRFVPRVGYARMSTLQESRKDNLDASLESLCLIRLVECIIYVGITASLGYNKQNLITQFKPISVAPDLFGYGHSLVSIGHEPQRHAVCNHK